MLPDPPLKLVQLLSGGDLRSIGESDALALQIRDQTEFDGLFFCLFYPDRLVVMRAADAIEKITTRHPEYLQPHQTAILNLCTQAQNKELKWHLALLLPRLELDKQAIQSAWDILTEWLNDKANSKIVRVNALQGLFELQRNDHSYARPFEIIMGQVAAENIPSIQARIKKLK